MTFLIQSLNGKIVSMVVVLLWEWHSFQVPTPTHGFSLAAPSVPSSFFRAVLYSECDQDTSPGQGNRWAVSSRAGLTLEAWTSATSVFSCYEEGMQQEPRVAQRTEWEVWRSFKAAFSSLPPLRIDSRSWGKSCGPNQRAGSCCQKLLLPPFPPLIFSAPSAGDRHFSPAIKVFSSYTHDKCQSPLPSSVFHSLLFYSRKGKGGSTGTPIIYM